MWKRDSVSDVSFNYTPLERKGEDILLDEVKYTKKGRSKSIIGYDHFDITDNQAFIWRGAGWLTPITTKWRVEWISEKGDCIIVSFKKTLVSPAGVDILTKAGVASAQSLDDALEIVRRRKYLQDVRDEMITLD